MKLSTHIPGFLTQILWRAFFDGMADKGGKRKNKAENDYKMKLSPKRQKNFREQWSVPKCE